MKRIVAISFLCIFLLGKTEFVQILRVSALIEHFLEHNHLDPKINLWEFFSIHYANSKTIDSDFKKDMNLPFKSNINLISFDLLALPISYVTKEITCIDLNENNGIIAYKNNFIHASLLSNIWQPPRMACREYC